MYDSTTQFSLNFDTPQIMAIVNATPDSYYTASRKESLAAYSELIDTYITEGANIIDIGAQSTRPNASIVDENEEWKRLEPILELMATRYTSIPFSVDSYYSSIIHQSYAYGCKIANDISFGSFDTNMKSTVAALQLPYIGMHIVGNATTMHEKANYTDIIIEVKTYFEQKIEEFKAAGVNHIIIDPGFGFSKTVKDNFTLLKNMSQLLTLQCPLLVGISRKSMIQKTLGVGTHDALNGTTVLHTLALQNGASILRVHDVKEAKDTIQLLTAYQKAE